MSGASSENARANVQHLFFEESNMPDVEASSHEEPDVGDVEAGEPNPVGDALAGLGKFVENFGKL